MAIDKAITDLPVAETVGNEDLFVLQQSNMAKSVDGATLKTFIGANAGGLTNDAKQALLTLLSHVAYTNENGQTYYDALESALYPPANLVSISVVFNQGSAVIYNTDTLDTLRQYLTVTALYDDTTTETVTTYTLSGTLTVGTSTVTVLYGDKTDTFSVTVENNSWDSIWNYTDGLPTTAGWTDSETGTATDDPAGLSLLTKQYSKDVAITNGAIEAKFTIVNERTMMSGFRTILRIGDSSNAIYVGFGKYSELGIWLYDSNTFQYGRLLGTWEFGGTYTLRLTINGSVGTVDLNGVTVADDIDTSTITQKGTLLFGSQTTYGHSIWEYVKYRAEQ